MHSEDAGGAFVARYGDGTTATRMAARVSLDTGALTITQADGEPIVWAYADLTVSDPLRKRSVDAIISTPSAQPASLYVDDTQLLAALIKRAPQISLGAGRWRDARGGLLVGALALAGYASLWIFDLSPSKGVAQMMPLRARTVLGDKVIGTMPQQKRCDTHDARLALTHLTQRLMPNGPITAENIIVIDWSLLNAFAVPGNRIVLTRGLLEQAKGADEIAAVIGHEAGHSIELHPEAGMVRSVGFWALVQMVFTGTPGAVGNVGVVLAQLGYTRSAERQADAHALRMMKDAHISPQPMADFFRRMQGRAPVPSAGGATVSDILSSHPSNPERIARIESQPAYETTPALPDAEWVALKTICGRPPVAAVRPAANGDAKPTPDTTGKRSETANPPAHAEADRNSPTKADDERVANSRPDAHVASVPTPRPEPSPAAQTKVADAAKATTAAAAMTKDATKEPVKETHAQPARPAGTDPTLPPDQRIAEASKRIAADKTDAGAYLERGQAHSAKGDTTAAVEDFSRALELAPTDARTLFWRAATYAQRGETDKAVADYSDVIRLQPGNLAAYNNRASLYRVQKKLDLALKDYSAAISIDSKEAIALTNRALVYREQNKLDAALTDLNAAVAANPGYATAYARRGETLELKSQREAAIADYRAVLRLPEATGAASDAHRSARARLTALGVKF